MIREYDCNGLQPTAPTTILIEGPICLHARLGVLSSTASIRMRFRLSKNLGAPFGKHHSKEQISLGRYPATVVSGLRLLLIRQVRAYRSFVIYWHVKSRFAGSGDGRRRTGEYDTLDCLVLVRVCPGLHGMA